ncbi:hypothetical protein ACFUPX_35695, partial [Streptomyces sp. NPDC057302]
MPEMTSGLKVALAEASSPSWEQRVRAGRDLASSADVSEVAEALVGLLLDVEDTAVGRQTAESRHIPRRWDPLGCDAGARDGASGRRY